MVGFYCWRDRLLAAGNDIQTQEDVNMTKRMMVLFSLLLTIFIPEVSFSQNEVINDSKDLDKLEILSIKNELRDNIKTLSLIKDDLKKIYTSMSAHQAKDRSLIINSCKNVENIEGIWMYLEGSLEQVLLIKKDKISYYWYLGEYGIEQMKTFITENLNDIQRMHSQISNNDALHIIDKAKATTRSSSEVLNNALEIIKQHAGALSRAAG